MPCPERLCTRHAAHAGPHLDAARNAWGRSYLDRKPTKPPVLFVLLTCTDGASHETPEFLGPFADEEARTLAAARALVDFFGSPNPDAWNPDGDAEWDRYAWRVDASEAEGLRTVSCVTEAEATAALIKAGVVPVDDAGNPIYPDTGDADEGEHDA